MKILTGHNSPETAFVVDDYPYGFRLRCKIRYWIEFNKSHGCRMVSQTTNPKRGHAWNKPKASTYSRFGLVMVQADNGHVINGGGCNEYDTLVECITWRDNYGATLPEPAKAVLDAWIVKKAEFDRLKSTGAIAMVTRCNGIETNRTVLGPELQHAVA